MNDGDREITIDLCGFQCPHLDTVRPQRPRRVCQLPVGSSCRLEAPINAAPTARRVLNQRPMTCARF